MTKSNCSILIVDDFQSNVLLVEHMLKNEGYQIVKAFSGEEALEKLKAYKVDLVLLDIIMPGLSGFDVATYMKSDEILNKIPIIFFTSQTNEKEIVKGFEHGGEDYIFKPFREKELLARVKTHIELKIKREKLENLNNQLEKTVTEKTEQLKRALNELEKAYEKLEHANKQLYNLNKAKSDFIKIISHEMRTPLNGIIGFSELIKMSNQSEDLLEYINILVSSANRLEEFSEQALLLTEMQMGTYKIHLQEFELLVLINEILAIFSYSIEEKTITINCNIEPHQTLIADKQLVRKAMYNLLDNAIRYSEKKGKITISFKYCKENICEITVEDYGKGFSKEAQENLFSLFAAGEGHIDKNPGLGLATVKMIMDLHSGDVSVAQPEHNGSLVKLSFSSPHL